MAGIYIPGVEMHQGELGALAVIIFADGAVFHYHSLERLGKAIPVPDHGRLISERDVKWAFDDAIIDEAKVTGKVRATSDEIAKVIASVPTIIPADKEETE